MRVLHLVGSAVSGFYADVSRMYAQDCLEATADPARYEPLIAYVEPGGGWRFPSSLEREEIAAAPVLDVGAAVQRLVALAPDVMVPQMFCLPGMTHYRALFDVLGVPYVGNAPEAMALTADKARAKAVVAAAGVAVPAGEVLRRGERPTLPPPVVVKPADADNSLGVTLVRSFDEYASALESAFAHSAEVLVEAFVPAGREVRCGVLERDGELVCLPLEEYRVDTGARAIRTHQDKIAPGADGELTLVAKDNPDVWILDADDPLAEPVGALARACHRALGCRHYSLFDVRVDDAGEPWFLEAGLYCSFARKSVISVMAQAAGTPVDELFRVMVEECLRG